MRVGVVVAIAFGAGCSATWSTTTWVATNGEASIAPVDATPEQLDALYVSGAHDLACERASLSVRPAPKGSFFVDGCGSRAVYGTTCGANEADHRCALQLTAKFPLSPGVDQKGN